VTDTAKGVFDLSKGFFAHAHLCRHLSVRKKDRGKVHIFLDSNRKWRMPVRWVLPVASSITLCGKWELHKNKMDLLFVDFRDL